MLINGKTMTLDDLVISTRHRLADEKPKNKNAEEKDNYVWVAYDSTRKRLPVAVAETAAELARIVGATTDAVYCAASKLRSGYIQNARFARVYIGGDEGDD